MRSVPLRTALKVIYWNAAAAVVVFALGWTAYLRRVHQFDAVIVEVAHTHGVDPRLVAAVIWRESRFNPTLIGDAGEIGLMQVTEAAAREWAKAERLSTFTKSDLFDVRTNVRAGTWYLARAIRYWSGTKADPLPFALAEYNAGRSNAARWAAEASEGRALLERITYPTTKRYVRDILQRYRHRV
jgi:soluble lytic murein transglycosylase